jgi:hypothetical protein
MREVVGEPLLLVFHRGRVVDDPQHVDRRGRHLDDLVGVDRILERSRIRFAHRRDGVTDGVLLAAGSEEGRDVGGEPHVTPADEDNRSYRIAGRGISDKFPTVTRNDGAPGADRVSNGFGGPEPRSATTRDVDPRDADGAR